MNTKKTKIIYREEFEKLAKKPDNTYEIEVKCRNCGLSGWSQGYGWNAEYIVLKKGTEVKFPIKCPECETKNLVRDLDN